VLVVFAVLGRWLARTELMRAGAHGVKEHSGSERAS